MSEVTAGKILCTNCRFFRLNEMDGFVANEDPVETVGYCHRYAPRSLVGPYSIKDVDRDIVVWPCVCGDEFCGEFEAVSQTEAMLAIETLGLSSRARNVVEYQLGAETVGDVTKFTVRRLLAVVNCGLMTVREIQTALGERNLALSGSEVVFDRVKSEAAKARQRDPKTQHFLPEKDRDPTP